MFRNQLRFVLRGLRRDPLYAAAVAGTLALTLGASTAVFSIVNGVLLRPLAYPDAGRLVSVREIVPKWARQYPTLPANARHFEEWRQRLTSFASIAALDWRTTNISGAGDPFQATVLRSSGTLFDVLQLPVAMGRPLARSDERADQPRVTVISHELWRERLGGDAGVLGRTLTLGGTDYTIVGVLPPRFEAPVFDVLGDSALLRSEFAAVMPFRLNVSTMGWMGQFNYPVIARLKPAASIEQARAELGVLQDSIATIASRDAGEPVELRARITRLDETIVGRARLGLLLLLGAILGVVLIACANLANLSLTRTLGRMRDVAVQTALGASRASLVGTVVLEQLLLAAVGAGAGILIAREALTLFVSTAPIDIPRVSDVAIDARVLGFSAAIAIAAGLAVALLPAWRIGRGDVQAMLRGGGRGITDRGGANTRSLLLGVQVALSVTLLAVTGLFVTSFARLLAVDTGFSTDNAVTIEIAPANTRYPDVPERAALYDRIAERARALPGVEAVAWTSALPLTGETWVDGIVPVDTPMEASQRPHANYRFVGPDYFRVLSMPLLKGRSFEQRDRSGPIVPAVLSARAAHTLWPGDDAIGKQFRRADPAQRFEVVGVVVDGHPTSLETESPLMVYVPYWFNNEGKSVLMARTTGDAATVISALRSAIRAVDPQMAIGDAAPLGAIVDKAVAGRRYQTTLFTTFGAVALLIAIVGVYATTTYAVSRRRRELNIRVALGAPTTRVFALVLRQTAIAVAAGAIAGCAGALAMGHVVAGLLFQARPRDPMVLIAVMALVGGAGLVAAAMAAKQNLRIDPVEALKDE